MPTDRILTYQCDTTLVGRGLSSDSKSHSRGRPHCPARLGSGPGTGHKTRAIFDRYNIINEQELLEAGDQLVAYLAQQPQAPGVVARIVTGPHDATRQEDVLQLSKSGKRAIGRVGQAPSHAATSNKLLMN